MVLTAATVIAVPSTAGAALQIEEDVPRSESTAGYSISTSRSYANANYVGSLIGSSKKRTVDWVLDKANRAMEPVSCQTAPGKALYYLATGGQNEYGFCWKQELGSNGQPLYTDDPDTTLWYPQGITTTADALGSTYYDGVQAVAVAWNRDNQSVRLSLAPARGYGWGNGKYRHLLLVNPRSNGDFDEVPCHAGGAMWYGNMLYVACTDHIRLFSWDHVYSADTTSFCQSRVGRFLDGSTRRHCATGYAYVMLQVGTIYPNGSKDIRFSTISLDRAATPDKLVIGQYDTDPGGRIWRFDLDYTDRLPARSTPYDVHRVPFDLVQGTTSRNNRFWFNSSGGPANYGKLRYWVKGDDTLKAYTGVRGAESVSYWGWGDGDGGQPDMLYTLSEHPQYRGVIAVRQADFN